MPKLPPHVCELEVPIVVELGRREMTVREVMSLLPGAVIELPKTADDELELLVNNRSVASGVAVKVGENFGIRLSSVGDIRERASAALGAGESDDADAEALAEKLLAGL